MQMGRSKMATEVESVHEGSKERDEMKTFKEILAKNFTKIKDI